MGPVEVKMLNAINIIEGRMGEWAEPILLSRITPLFFYIATKCFNLSVSIMGAVKRTGPPQERDAKRLVSI